MSEAAESSFTQLLRNGDARGNPFADSVDGRLLIYPTEGSLLTDEQFRALRHAAEQENEDTGLIVELGNDKQPDWDEPDALLCVSLSHFASYARPSTTRAYEFVENAILSPSGRWAVLLSSDGYAVVGSSQHFIKTLASNLSLTRSEMLVGFVHHWSNLKAYGFDVTWVPKLIEHLYGPEEARVALEQLS